MTPYHSDPWLTVYHGDARAVMAEMEPESVHCVVTSPPYFGLRDYGSEGQIGLEDSVADYVATMVEVFRGVRRVLRSDGSLWLNLGDSYAGSWGARGRGEGTNAPRPDLVAKYGTRTPQRHAEAKPKDLLGVPWRVAFALQADGWYLRSDIIWSKPNPMPESVTDRPTKAHEYLFLLSKAPRYYWDADAVREAHQPDGRRVTTAPLGPGSHENYADLNGHERWPNAGRNLRSVWTIATAPYPGAHFATFPRKLVEPCIKAGTSEKGVCPECGAPWVREVEREKVATPRYATSYADAHGPDGRDSVRASLSVTTLGWRSSCQHPTETPAGVYSPVPATVLDPFAGSGTTGMVAQSLSRRAVLIDLSMDYLDQLMDRNRDMPLGLGA